MKNAVSRIKNILVWLISAVAIGMMVFTVASVLTLNQRERNLLGYRAFIVLSDSMSATDFDAGDVVVVKETDPAALQPGDIIRLDRKVEDELDIYVGNIRKFTALPGSSQDKYAVRITSVIREEQ